MGEASKHPAFDQRVLLYDPSRCTGCLSCEISCVYHHYRILDTRKAHLHILAQPNKATFEAICCQHCDEPVCAASCPTEAISKDVQTGWVTINALKCIGCQNCVFACPLSAPWFDLEHYVSAKCDFCEGDPECTKVCSPQAIRVARRGELWAFNKKLYAQRSEKHDG